VTCRNVYPKIGRRRPPPPPRPMIDMVAVGCHKDENDDDENDGYHSWFFSVRLSQSIIMMMLQDDG
jgi:hypothetical protein